MAINSFFGEYRFLSNFWACDVYYEGLTYPSSEAAYQAAKTLDMNERRQFLNLTPGQAKRFGKKITLRDDWEEVKCDVMSEIVWNKFNGNSYLTNLLIATGDEELIEGNTWHDNTWGNCSCDRCKNIQGKNYLGKILMNTRKRLSLAIAD